MSYTMAVRAGTKAIAQVIATIAEKERVPIVYPQGGEAAVAETTYKRRRLVVRRTRLVGPQATPSTASAPRPELDIRDLKEGAGMDDCPAGSTARGPPRCVHRASGRGRSRSPAPFRTYAPLQSPSPEHRLRGRRSRRRPASVR